MPVSWLDVNSLMPESSSFRGGMDASACTSGPHPTPLISVRRCERAEFAPGKNLQASQEMSASYQFLITWFEKCSQQALVLRLPYCGDMNCW